MLTVGLALLCSCLNAHYRDVGYIVDVALTFGFYATPIFYGIEKVRAISGHSLVAKLYMLNPMVGIISAYRQTLLDNQAPALEFVLYPLTCSVFVMVVGVFVFRRRAPLLADHL
jgi:ABC-type polysaccharide/polyol phosphate export permease